MKARFVSQRFQFVAVTTVAIGALLYCVRDGELSLWTPDQRGYRLYATADYREAAARFIDPMWRGVALFRAGEFAEAGLLFAGYDTAEAAFNQGNALVMQGQYEPAIERFTRALELRPGWDDPRINRDIALARAEALKIEGGDMTGGRMGADEIVFEKGESSPSAGEEQLEAQQEATDAELRSIWLRQVQTRPADFLRAKFAQQYATREATGE